MTFLASGKMLGSHSLVVLFQLGLFFVKGQLFNNKVENTQNSHCCQHDGKTNGSLFLNDGHHIQKGKVLGSEEQEEHGYKVEEKHNKQRLILVEAFLPGVTPENKDSHEDEDGYHRNEQNRSSVGIAIVPIFEGDSWVWIGYEPTRIRKVLIGPNQSSRGNQSISPKDEVMLESHEVSVCQVPRQSLSRLAQSIEQGDYEHGCKIAVDQHHRGGVGGVAGQDQDDR